MWSDLKKAPYKKLFNAGTSGKYVFHCVQLQRIIDKELSEYQKTLNGRQEGVIVHGNRVLSLLLFNEIGSENLQDPSWSVESVDLTLLKERLEKNYKALYYIFDAEYKNAVIPTFFKNRSKCKKIIDLVPEFIELV